MQEIERSVCFVVQSWSERYEYWAATMEPAETMFGLPVTSYPTILEARARKAMLGEMYPSGSYRIVKVTKTFEVID